MAGTVRGDRESVKGKARKCACNGVNDVGEVKIGYDGIVFANSRKADPAGPSRSRQSRSTSFNRCFPACSPRFDRILRHREAGGTVFGTDSAGPIESPLQQRADAGRMEERG